MLKSTKCAGSKIFLVTFSANTNIAIYAVVYIHLHSFQRKTQLNVFLSQSKAMFNRSRHTPNVNDFDRVIQTRPYKVE